MKLREKHWRAMSRVRKGAAIYSNELADLLREVEEMRPQYIDIANTWAPPAPGEPRNPWFHAMLTPVGALALDRHNERTGQSADVSSTEVMS